MRPGASRLVDTRASRKGRRAAYYVDRVLKGTKPADLPVERGRENQDSVSSTTRNLRFQSPTGQGAGPLPRASCAARRWGRALVIAAPPGTA